MAINYAKVKRTINVGNNPGEKFIARIVKEQAVDLDQIAEEIAGASTMSKADVLGVLQQLQVQMKYHLLRGAAVKLELLGSFTPSLRAKAVASPDEVNVQAIKGVHINFKPSKWLNKEVKDVSFRLVDPTIKGLLQEE
jgi:predicted histone-like DNA-binding protein